MAIFSEKFVGFILIVGAAFFSALFSALAMSIELTIHEIVEQSRPVVPGSRWDTSAFRLFLTHPVLLEATVNILYLVGMAFAGISSYPLVGLRGAMTMPFAAGFVNVCCQGRYYNGLRLKDRLEKTRQRAMKEGVADPQSRIQTDLTVLCRVMRHSRNPVLFFKKFIDFLLGPAGRPRAVVEGVLRMYAGKEVEVEASDEDGGGTEGLADILASAAQEQLRERFGVTW